MQHCPFCGTAETDRFDLDGHRFLVFGCMFTPQVDPALDEAGLERHLATAFPRDGSGAYFRRSCDRLHVYVTAGRGGTDLKAAGHVPPPD